MHLGGRTLLAVAETDDGPTRPRLTARGAATKARIIAAADQLMYERGVAQTSLTDVRTASGTSKSQLYQHFVDKEALVREVISHRAARLLEQQQQRLQRLDSLRGLERWRDALIERNGTGVPSVRWLPNWPTRTRRREGMSSAISLPGKDS